MRTETVVVEKHRTNRDAIVAGLVLGAAVTILVYESAVLTRLRATKC